MMSVFLRAFAVGLPTAVLAMMLKVAGPDGDLDKKLTPFIEETVLPTLKSDLRPIVFLDTNHLGERIVTNTVTLQKHKLPKGSFELIFNSTFTSLYVGGLLDDTGDEFIVEEDDM